MREIDILDPCRDKRKLSNSVVTLRTLGNRSEYHLVLKDDLKNGWFVSKYVWYARKTIVNWYTKEYFLLRIFDIDFGLKKMLMVKKTSFKLINNLLENQC